MAALITVGLTLLETSAREASVGKRTQQLRVVDEVTGLRVPFRRASLRDTLKIGVPWTIGHAAVFSILQVGAVGLDPRPSGRPGSCDQLVGMAEVRGGDLQGGTTAASP